jgi:hypothetical protein
LTITGTNGGNNLLFRQIAGRISIQGLSASWSAAKVRAIVVNLQDGDDTVSLDSLTNGGTQVLNVPVTVKSGVGDKSVDLANGHEADFSGFGHTLSVTAGGVASLGIRLWERKLQDNIVASRG